MRRTLLPLLVLVASFAPLDAGADPNVFNGEWMQLATNGATQSLPRDGAAIYDSGRDRALVMRSDGVILELDCATGAHEWIQTSLPQFPGAWGTARAVYDAPNDRMVVLTDHMTVSALSLAAPTAWSVFGFAGETPPERAFFAVAYDNLRNRLLLFGGGPSPTVFNDLWALDLTGTPRWSHIQPTGTAPPPTWGPLAAYDSARDRVIVGMGSPNPGYQPTSDLYSVNLAGSPAWSRLDTGSSALPGQMLTAAIYDVWGDALVTMSGYPISTNEVWSLALSPTPTWEHVAPTGTAPAARWSFNLLYRTTYPQMLLIGGFPSGSDAWSLTLTPIPGGCAPQLLAFAPAGGIAGSDVTVSGMCLGTVNEITFNGVPAPILSASYGQIQTRVPPGATTGPIGVVAPEGSATSAADFIVGPPPEVTGASVDSARVGEQFLLFGRHLTGATEVRIGGTGSAPFAIESDTVLTVTVDSLASSGPISVTTAIGTTSSAFAFLVLPDDYRPHLLGVHDAPWDQGGRVILSWRGSDFDQPRYRLITGYRVWRRAPATFVLRPGEALPAGMRSTPAPGGVAGDPLVFWENVAQLPSAYLRGYAYAGTTLRDSMAAGNPFTAFFIQALTADPYVFYDSSVDSGYSVDNLAPPAPMPFTAQYSPGQVALHWLSSPAADFQVFRLYRGSSEAFVPSAGSLVFAGRDTGFVDRGTSGGFYKLAAVDIHGNVSRYALVSPDNPVATLASLVSANWTGAAVSLVWYGAGLPGIVVNVYRSDDGVAWTFAAGVAADGDGYVRYSDTTVLAGHHYTYRLGIPDSGGEQFTSQVSIQVPAGRLAIRAVTSNPVRGGVLNFVADLAGAQPASVRIMDLAGRVVREQTLRAVLTGPQSVPLGNRGALRPGIYLLEVRQAGARAVARFVYLN